MAPTRTLSIVVFMEQNLRLIHCQRIWGMGTGAESKWQSPRALRVSLVSTAGSFEGTGTHLLVRFHQPVYQLRLYWTELCQRV